MEIQDIAFLAGIVFGCIAVGTACYVWWKYQRFGTGGAMLSFLGIALIGLSIWSGIRIEISEEGLKAEFQRLEQFVAQVAEANQTIASEVQKVAASNAASRQKIVALATLIEKDPGRVDPAEVRKLREDLVMAPDFDPTKLQRATRDLERLQMQRLSGSTPH